MQPTLKSAPILPSWTASSAILLALSVAAICTPVWLYSTTLAIFGGMHVLSELRYVELRFGARLKGLMLPVGLFLAGLVVLRGGAAADFWPRDIFQLRLENLAIIGLALLCMPRLIRSGVVPTLVGGSVVVLVGWGLVRSPVLTAFILSALHNWTPVGFLAEAVPTPERRKGLVLAVVGFGVLPILLATGWGQSSLAGLVDMSTEIPGLLTGAAEVQVSGWPATVRRTLDAPALFAALAFAQCMHYIAVIGLMPRICPEVEPSAEAWFFGRVSAHRFWQITAVLCGVLVLGFCFDFSLSRTWYFVPATLHAWIELPALLLALTGSGPDQPALRATVTR